jgi:hypothetical protein
MRTNPLTRLGRDTAYVVLGLPLAVAAFVVMVTGLSLSAGLLVTLLGLPVTVATLAAARGLGAAGRAHLRVRDDRPMPPQGPVIRRGEGLRGWLAPLVDGRAWLATLHSIVGFPIAIVTFVVTVTWYAAALGGLTSWIWTRWLPENTVDDSQQSLAELLGYGPGADVWVQTAIGVLALLTLYPVVRLCAVAQASFARLLLAGGESQPPAADATGGPTAPATPTTPATAPVPARA